MAAILKAASRKISHSSDYHLLWGTSRDFVDVTKIVVFTHTGLANDALFMQNRRFRKSAIQNPEIVSYWMAHILLLYLSSLGQGFYIAKTSKERRGEKV
jgi:hypothetical protein